LRTIAGELEAALSRLFDRPVKVTCAGRTDAGVHASAQVVSFVSHQAFPVDKLAIALNTSLPPDVTARDATRVEAGFSARNSALSRRYTYAIVNRRHPSAVMRRCAHHEYRTLDLDRMRVAGARAIGEHDFITFCSVLPDRGGTVRTLHAIEVEAQDDVVRLHFDGAGFLHRMVRILTGTLLDVGAGRRETGCIAEMLAARDRRAAGPTAPAHGLTLVNVRYPGWESRPAGEPPIRRNA